MIRSRIHFLLLSNSFICLFVSFALFQLCPWTNLYIISPPRYCFCSSLEHPSRLVGSVLPLVDPSKHWLSIIRYRMYALVGMVKPMLNWFVNRLQGH
jgi:hypothetical protein